MVISTCHTLIACKHYKCLFLDNFMLVFASVIKVYMFHIRKVIKYT